MYTDNPVLSFLHRTNPPQASPPPTAATKTPIFRRSPTRYKLRFSAQPRRNDRTDSRRVRRTSDEPAS